MIVAALVMFAATSAVSMASAAPAVAGIGVGVGVGVGVAFDGGGLSTLLTATPGDATRGRAIVVNRRQGLCLLCHSGPFPEESSAGNLATNLDGAGSRWTEAQLRARIVDARRLDPASLMPAFYATDSRQRVAAAWQDRPILDAQQVEDVVAFLQTLK